MSRPTRPTLVLFDAHAILHRAYHAIPDFTTASGKPTGALYGLANLLIKTIHDFHPERMAACYDLPKPTFRDALYKEYKGKRQKTDAELITQIKESREIFSGLGIPVYDAEGFEGDDVIGTLAEQAKKTFDILIVTGDMDTLQLVDKERVRVYTLKKGITDTIIYDEDAVLKRYGFGPEYVPDYKGLRGDPSDNIIGIPGIGEKTATTLITAFGSIEDMYKTLKKKDGEKKFLDAGLSPRIVSLLRDHEEDATFSKMLATIRRDAPITLAHVGEAHKELFTIEHARAVFEKYEFKSLIRRLESVFGIEATHLVTTEDAPQAPVVHVDEGLWTKAKIAMKLLDSTDGNPSQEEFLDLPGNTPDEKLAGLEARITKEKLDRVYRDIELPLIPIIEKIQKKGVLVDVKYLQTLSKEYHEALNKSVKAIYKHAGEEFNINSPKQLGVVLFDKLALTAKGLRKTEGGARSTRESELEKLKDSHPIVAEVLTYREYQKLLSTYVDSIPTVVAKDGRLHTTLNQIGAATGRMSSTDPNLQNIPVREGVGERIRDAFMAPKGRTLLAFDYSQIEMRILAVLSKDGGLAEIFSSGEDVHTSVASRVFKVKPEDVSKDMRRKAKVINFGIIYGMGVSALQRSLGSTRAEAQVFYDDYLGAFPRAAAFLDATIEEAKKLRHTTTLFGRKRSFPDIASKIPFVRAAAERAAMNAPIQGTAADVIKIAMKNADDALTREKLTEKVDMILQVHDELMFEVDDDRALIKKTIDVVKEAMESVLPDSKIALRVSVKRGERWGSMTEYTAM